MRTVFRVINIIIGLTLLAIGFYQFESTWRVMHVYQETSCTITQQIPDANAAFLAAHDPSNAATSIFAPDFHVNFSLNNQIHSGTVSVMTLHGKSGENALFSQYKVGQVYSCWYDPNDLRKIVFKRNDNYFDFLWFFVIWILIVAAFKARSLIMNTLQAIVFKKPVKVDVDNNKTTKTPPWGAVVICFIFLLPGLYMMYQDITVNYTFIATQCEVLDKILESENTISKNRQVISYSTIFHVTYLAAGKTQNEWTSESIIKSASDSPAIDQQYLQGKIYPCWYDPASPDTVVLKRGFSIFTIVWCSLTSILFLGALANALASRVKS